MSTAVPFSVRFYPTDIARVVNVLAPRLRMRAGQYRGCCPIHKGKRDSFSLNQATGKWTCHSECGSGSLYDFVMKLEGLEFREAATRIEAILGHPPKQWGQGPRLDGTQDKGPKGRIISTYDYTDEHGQLLFQAVRYEPKNFSQRRPDGNGGWIGNLQGVRRVLFHLPQLLNAPVAVVVEGEKDCLAAEALGFTATTAPMGAGKWLPSYSDALAGKDVIIIPDTDADGQVHLLKVAAALQGKARSIRVVRVPAPHKDISDWIAAGAKQETITDAIDRAEEYQPDIVKPQPADARFQLKILDGRTLLNAEFPEQEWIVDKIIPVGLSLLASRPKKGKSWMSLQAAICVAGSKPLFGRYPARKPGRVLYFALEDGPRRIHNRLQVLLHEEAELSRIDFAHELPKLSEGGVSVIAQQLAREKYSFVVIDTLVACSSATRPKDGFRGDYNEINLLTELARQHSVGVLLLHHTKKPFQGSIEDPLDQVLGTTGVTAAADNILVIGNQGEQKLLHVISRDAESQDLAVQFNLNDGTGWQVQGEAKEVMLSRERKAVLAVIRNRGKCWPRDIAAELGKPQPTIRRLLHEMYSEGQVYKLASGEYDAGPTNVQ